MTQLYNCPSCHATGLHHNLNGLGETAHICIHCHGLASLEYVHSRVYRKPFVEKVPVKGVKFVVRTLGQSDPPGYKSERVAYEEFLAGKIPGLIKEEQKA